MNKFLKLLIFSAVLVGTGIIYQNFYRPPSVGPVKETGRVVEIVMRAIENQWRWDPPVVRVKAGDRIRLKVFNEDTYDHGIAVEAFGINKRLFPRRETLVDFVASRVGEYKFYCSVPCGAGHYDQIGKLIVEE